VSSLVPALLGDDGLAPAWLPEPARSARQVVLLVLDGLGWEQLTQRSHLAPTLSAMEGGPITTVAPTTTATALTSITTGLAPAAHGVVGYRVRVGGDDVLNILRWRTLGGDARDRIPPDRFQPLAGFAGACPPVVTRAEFKATGFTRAHLNGTRMFGWRVTSSMVVEVGRLLAAGEPFLPGIGGDVADPAATEEAYDRLPVAALLSMSRGLEALLPRLGAVACPVLILTSRHDKVVDPVSSEVLAGAVSGPVERVWLERSGHVATLDVEAPDVERRVLVFARRVTPGDHQ